MSQSPVLQCGGQSACRSRDGRELECGARQGLLQSSGERRSQCLHPLIKARRRDPLPPVYVVRGNGWRSSSPARGEEGGLIVPSLGWGGWCSPSAVSASCGEVSAPRSHKDAFWTCELAPVLYTAPLPQHERTRSSFPSPHHPPAVLLQAPTEQNVHEATAPACHPHPSRNRR